MDAVFEIEKPRYLTVEHEDMTLEFIASSRRGKDVTVEFDC